MTDTTCACGFTATSDYDLADHFGEMFIPDNDMDTAGQVHAETAPAKCLCGYVAATTAVLDEHLLTAFTLLTVTGRDGRDHVATATR